MCFKHLTLFILFLLIACEKVDLEQEQHTSSNGTAHSSTTDSNGSSTKDAYRTSRHPKALTLYNNAHVIVFSDAFHPDSAELTLLSFYDWSDIPSANSIEDPTLARLLAEGYEEQSEPLDTLALGSCGDAFTKSSARLKEPSGTLEPTGTSVPELVEGETLKPSETYSEASWHIPTVEEAKRLRSLYGSSQPALDSLNTLLQSIGAPEVALQSGKVNTRYLCDEGRKSFSFVDGTTISQAGTKATYHLRLLKTFRINLYQGVRHLGTDSATN